MPIVGGFFGSLAVSQILRILSRKQTMILLNCLFIAGNIIVSAGSGPTGSYEAFMIGRLVAGFGIGLGISKFFQLIEAL